MNINKLTYLMKALAKFMSTSVRLYSGDEQVDCYSVYPISPDPLSLYESEYNLLSQKLVAGVFTTDLFQYYGYVTFDCGYRAIIGPSSMLIKDTNKLERLMFFLGVKEADKADYVSKLECAPIISAERMAWLLTFAANAINSEPICVEDVFVQTGTKNYGYEILKTNMENALFIPSDTNHGQLASDSYKAEKMMSFYIKNGQPEALKELMNAMPKIKAGTMSHDTLRQIKNMGICSAAIASRSAIEGGLSVQMAFSLSDLYIQKFEIINNPSEIFLLINKMMLEFAQRTKQSKFNCDSTSMLFLKCADYVSRNLFKSIKITDMAIELELSRPYLCSKFHRQTGITLTHYISNEKIIEAKRLLRFTDESLSSIAMHLAFSSQSHFQTAFKKLTGVSPNKYRNLQTDLQS